VSLARALVVEPETLLLDEPLSNLDANLREEMRFEIRRLHDKFRYTTVYVTHDQAEAMTTSDLIVVMNQGASSRPARPRTSTSARARSSWRASSAAPTS
jgi:iron(III) transport system ATP-binding protein